MHRFTLYGKWAGHPAVALQFCPFSFRQILLPDAENRFLQLCLQAYCYAISFGGKNSMAFLFIPLKGHLDGIHGVSVIIGKKPVQVIGWIVTSFIHVVINHAMPSDSFYQLSGQNFP